MDEQSVHENVSVYLDVDGVLCPYGPVGTTDWGNDWQHAGVGGTEVAYAPELVAELNNLSHRTGVRFVWLTTWEELAPRLLCRAIGLEGSRWPVLSYGDQGRRHDWWKLEAIRADTLRHGPRRAVWIDDQLGGDGAAMAWVARCGRRVLGIAPDPGCGISRTELESIKAFLAAGGQEQVWHAKG